MAQGRTKSGYEFDSARLDRVERRFWREIWDAVPVEVAAERGIERHAAGSVQATVVGALAEVSMMNLVLGATEPGAVDHGYLEDALAWAEARGASPYVPVSPGPEAAGAESVLAARGYRRGYGWMKFVRDAHPPRFRAPEVEVVELTGPDQEPFGAIAATGFGLPAWGGDFFGHLPGRPGWRCYVARIGGEAQACAAILIEGDVAEFGIAATLEPARGRGCQLALLHRRIADAAAAGCTTLFVETGERTPARPSTSYRNILRAGFEEAYVRPNWVRAG
ncbi:MAG TPA: GNAT family N-acetyltransferase [Solirubrobacterales bacterium]|nr:GNAT family N-acetyltransferase [Solirubrobacterales bacterium]